jgi:hypothetical protein
MEELRTKNTAFLLQFIPHQRSGVRVHMMEQKQLNEGVQIIRVEGVTDAGPEIGFVLSSKLRKRACITNLGWNRVP